jgi:hypothetical protein
MNNEKDQNGAEPAQLGITSPNHARGLQTRTLDALSRLPFAIKKEKNSQSAAVKDQTFFFGWNKRVREKIEKRR